jgi:class 3 adenylate cyclase/tetratricopeptide (TPR) repeat protein
MTNKAEERRLLTILFADLSGFTALSARLDPEEVREAVNISFEHLNKLIAAEGGTVLKYEGDLVMAVFGHPASHEDDPERAVRAALGMFQRLPDVNRDLAARLRIEGGVGLHAGINSGTVVVGEIGSAEKREHTVMGEAVNLASRLKDAARDGEILVTQPVFRGTRYLFEYEPRPKIQAKGFDRPVAVFRPVKTREKPEPKRGIAGLASPMVGRDRELAALLEDVRGLEQGRGGATFVVGEAGLGKSRLLSEFRSAIAEKRMAVELLEGRCLTYGQNAAYWPVLQALEGTLGISDSDEPAAVLEKISGRCRQLLAGDWMLAAPYLARLFSLKLPEEMEEKVAHLDVKVLKDRTHLALKTLLSALGSRRPVLLVVDDYHWADEATTDFLLHMLGRPAPPVRLLALTRPERDSGGRQARERFQALLGDSYKEIVLSPLDAVSGTSLAFNLLNVPGIGQGFKDMLLAKSGGNPFYLEEIVRSLIDSGTLAYSNGVWRLTGEVSELAVPDTVQSLIAARLDRLESDLRETLQTASVLGRSFHVRLLEALSGLDDMMLNLYLATLEEFDFISETRREPEAEYAFRHPLSQEVAYQTMLKKRRRELHRLAGQAIERAYAGRLDDFAEILAHHYSNSDDQAKALEWLGRAGRKARERFANREAISFFRPLAELLELQGGRQSELCQACSALGELHSLLAEMEEADAWYRRMEQHAGGDKALRSQAKRKQADVSQKQARYDQALETLASAEADLPALSEAELLEQAEIRTLRSWILRIKGDTTAALREGESALRILEADLAGAGKGELGTDIARARIKVLNSLGGICYVQGEYDRAIGQFQAAAGISRELGDLNHLSTSLCNTGIMHYCKGELARAMEYYREFMQMADRIGNRKALATAYGNMAIIHQERGEYGLALDLHQKSLEINQESGDRIAVAMNFGNMGLVYKSRGELQRAAELFNAYRDTALEIGFKQGVGIAGLNLANICNMEGRTDLAESNFREAEPIFVEVGDKASLCEVYTGLADIKGAKKETLPEALELAGRARALALELGSAVCTGNVEWTFGNLRVQAGEHLKAEEHFGKALAAFEEAGQKRVLADLCHDYARMLRKSGQDAGGRAGELMKRAGKIYAELGLEERAAQCG